MENIKIVRKNLDLEDILETEFNIRSGKLKTTDSINPIFVCINLDSLRWLEEVLYKYSPEVYLFFTSDIDITLFRRKYQGFSNIKFFVCDSPQIDLHKFSLFLSNYGLNTIDVLKVCGKNLTYNLLNSLQKTCAYKYIQVGESEITLDSHKKIYTLPGFNSLWEKEMSKIHIRDNNFFSEQYPERPNKYFDWVWDRSPVDSDITVFSDSFIREAEDSKSKVKIAWLIEPPVINSFIYEYVANNHHLFDQIYTFDERLLKVDPKFKFFTYGTTWIHNPQKSIYTKSKLVSAVFSFKKFTEGHRIRHNIFDQYRDTINFYGSINNKRIEHKVEGLKDYAFSVVVENWNGNNYFSEKLMDCLMTGTIPIYWGFSNYGDFFNPDGFLYFKTLEEFKTIMDNLSMDLYKDKLSAVEENFVRAFNYIDLEEKLWYGGLKDIVNE
jgi:hypothetical protein